MRCSTREPAMFTSTPIHKPRRKSEFLYFENSPIPKLYKNSLHIPEQLVKYQDQRKQSISIFKVLGNKKIPLNGEERNKAVVLRKQAHPPMVVISDSEEEDKINKEITTLQNLLNPSSSNKSASKNMDTEQHKSVSSKHIRSRSTAKQLKEDISEPETKKSMRRTSRVATIIDEVMKERMSTIVSPPSVVNGDPVVKERESCVKSGRFTRSQTAELPLGDSNFVRETQRRKLNVPNFSVEKDVRTEVVETIKTIKETNARKTRKRTKSIFTKNEEKENNIQYDKDPQPGGQVLTQCKIKNEAVKEEKILNTELRGKILNEQKPVIYKLEDIKGSEWMQVTGQNGVFAKKIFSLNTIYNGFIKIEKKCFLNLNSPKYQIFCVVEGRGIFSYDNVKDKVGPGQTITIPYGVSCEIHNTGTKKNMVLSFTKVSGE